jgi:hypothetical protein
MPGWLSWGFWISPLAYAQLSTAINEFLAPRWQKVNFVMKLINGTNQLATTKHSTFLPAAVHIFQETMRTKTIGNQILTNRGLYYNWYFYWISVGALLGFIILFYIAFGLTLAYRKRKFTTKSA